MNRALLLVAVAALSAIAAASAPYRWTHGLTEGCKWKPGPLSMLGKPHPSVRDQEDRRRCLVRKGWKGDSQTVREILRRWPHESPLPPPAHPADVQSRPRR